jgi:lysophospholipase L1-like esterase
MRSKLIAAALVAAASMAPASAAAAAKPANSKQYYLALGDSLARGGQPNSSGKTVPTDQGYANDIYTYEQAHMRGLAFKDLGCLGETTTTMIKGGICKYAAGSQLKAAVKFLRAHKGRIPFVTIDIGANDVDNCVTKTGFNLKCIAKGEAAIEKNIPKITAALRKAAGSKVPVVGMTYYDPFLADWFNGTTGQQEAAASQALAKSVNGHITSAYKSKGARVAFVAAAFHTYKPLTDTTTYKGHQVPVAVAEICKLTWMCAPAPEGPNIHANQAGYSTIATVYEKKRL